jgi:hypothetical protein
MQMSNDEDGRDWRCRVPGEHSEDYDADYGRDYFANVAPKNLTLQTPNTPLECRRQITSAHPLRGISLPS